MLQGAVYKLTLSDHDSGNPHPHVVVLTFSGNRDCIVVPAYSIDGFKINEFIDSARGALRDDQIYIQFNNAEVIDFATFFPPKEAIWCVARHRRLSQKAVSQGDFLGNMKPAGLLAIASRLLSLAESDPRDLSPKAVKSLRNLVRDLTHVAASP